MNPVSDSGILSFAMDRCGHFHTSLSRDFQKRREEDVVCCILDVMETLGWEFKIQYDKEEMPFEPFYEPHESIDTSKEFTIRKKMFLFHKGICQQHRRI
jgi:hypothetical protein